MDIIFRKKIIVSSDETIGACQGRKALINLPDGLEAKGLAEGRIGAGEL
jgi:hypothetical protein